MAIELDNSFTVPVPPEQAWDVLLDVERIAPCMPGASVLSVDGDEIEGQVKVKLGPLSLSYKGVAKFLEKDEATHTISLDAKGKETRGAGTASAVVNASLKPADAAGQTVVSIHTSLNVTGRPAQFGRSLLPEVSGKLIGQFAANLEALIQQGGAGTAAPADGPAADTASADAASAGSPAVPNSTISGNGGATSGSTNPVVTPTADGPLPSDSFAASAPPSQDTQPEDSLNVVKLVAVPVLKRVVPVVVGVAVAAYIGRRIFRR